MEKRQYDNTNSGALFKNTRKEKETHPDFTGSGNIDGKEVWLNGWRKTDKNGNPFISMSFKPKDVQASTGAQQTQRVAAKAAVLEDEIPF